MNKEVTIYQDTLICRWNKNQKGNQFERTRLKLNKVNTFYEIRSMEGMR